MSRRSFRSCITLMVALASLACAFPALAARPRYPATPVHMSVDTIGGHRVPDPYRWLENPEAPAVKAWIDRQNAFTRATLSKAPHQAQFRARLKELYAIPTVSRGEIGTEWEFFTRKEGGQNHAVVYARRGAKGTPRAILDPNTFSQDGTVALDWWYPSPSGAFIAYGKSAGGTEMSTLYLRDVEAVVDLPDTIPHTQRASLGWDPDGKGFVYNRHPAKGEVPAGEEMFREAPYWHQVGMDWLRDQAIFPVEGREVQELRGPGTTSDLQWNTLTVSTDWARNDAYIRPTGVQTPFRPVALGLDGRVIVDAYQGLLYILTNVKTPRFHILTAPAGIPGPENWKELIPEGKGVMQSLAFCDHKIVLLVAEAAISHLYVYGLDGKLVREIQLPAPGTVTGVNAGPTGTSFCFTFTSFTYPTTVFRCDVNTGVVTPFTDTRTALDASNFEVHQEWATSRDGTRFPMFVVHKKGLVLDGRLPTLLYGYGGFDVSENPYWSAAFFAWVEMGGVLVDANLRGGGEFGADWHMAGRLEKKQNVFDDFYAAAEYLIEHKYTSKSRLACMGGSNGGLLVGAAITQRPELWKAAVCQVPLLDMLKYHRYLIGKYWVPEYGSGDDPKQFDFLKAYSPYHNVKAGVRYPATLLTCGAGDTRVHPLHAMKMAALLQSKSAGDGPILLRVEGKAGHGQGKPVSRRMDEAMDEFGFLFMQLGM